MGPSPGSQERIPIILETDTGDDIDDALALQSPELGVRAVTIAIDDTETRTRLAWKELGLYGRHDNAPPGRMCLLDWRKLVGVEPTRDTKYRTTGLKPAPSTGQD